MKKLFLVTLAIISAYSFAYTDLDVSNAQYLADQKLITKQSSEAKFRLDDTITRAEVDSFPYPQPFVDKVKAQYMREFIFRSIFKVIFFFGITPCSMRTICDL